MGRIRWAAVLTLSFLAAVAPAQLPLDPGVGKPSAMRPLGQMPTSAGVMELMELDARFSRETLQGGGKVFASWFAPDGLTLITNEIP